MALDDAHSRIVSFFIESAKVDSFNGLRVTELMALYENSESLIEDLQQLVLSEKISCVFGRLHVNPHIKRLPDLPTAQQVELLTSEDLRSVCAYPTAAEIRKRADIDGLRDRPYSAELFLAEPQLAFRSFEMGALERYTSDPRYDIGFSDYMGEMSISGEYYSDEGFPERDKIGLQTFGLGFDHDRIPHIVVFLRYLAGLSPEHQQYWNSYQTDTDVRMCEQYYRSSILGDFWENRSVRYAICKEIELLKRISEQIWGEKVFKDMEANDAPLDLTSFLRPTNKNFQRFILALDKLLSESINPKFFEGKIALEDEVQRKDGKIVVQRKGTLRLLEEWLSQEVAWSDDKEFKDVIMKPLRKVRELRQIPAHKFSKDDFSKEYYKERKWILWSVFNSLSNIRNTIGKHPDAAGIEVPEWLNEGAGTFDLF